MSLRKMLLSTAIAIIATNTHAQYMGIENLSTTDNFTPVVLENAIKTENATLIDQWIKDKGRTIKYQPNDGVVCYVSANSTNHESAFKIKDASSYQGLAQSIVSNNVYAIISPCSTLPVSSLSFGIDLLHTPSAISQFGKGGTYTLSDKVISSTQFKIKYLNEFINGLTADQWEQLLPLVINQNLPLDIRMKALTMLEHFYAKRNSTENIHQKGVRSALENYVKKTPEYLTDNMPQNLYLNPYNYIFNSVFVNSIFPTKELNLSTYYNTSNIDKFTLKFWMDKETIDMNKFTFKSDNAAVLTAYLQLYNNSVILKRIIKNPAFNINEQNINGETFMHKLFDRYYHDVSDNVVFASFLRALLNYGADPRLLNTKKESPFMVFESLRGNSGKAIFDAFALKEYNK